MSSEKLLQVQSISKTFEIYPTPGDRLKQLLFGKRRKYYKDFHALSNVSFDLNKGETIGIIGSNGAGKSTLLQIVCGTLTPSSGKVTRNGKISALLELGAGFNAEFTGKDNIYLNCALHGMSRSEIDKKYQEIVDFADIGEFVNRPVKLYSSGMFARLAFSAAVHVNPDILIVDEALSVGDMSFQEKSVTKMKEIRDQGSSILFVTHSLSLVRNFCNKALWLEHGITKDFGERLAVCDAYQASQEEKIALAGKKITHTQSASLPSSSIELQSIRLNQRRYTLLDDITITISLNFHKKPLEFGIGLIFKARDGTIASIISNLRDGIIFNPQQSEWTLVIPRHKFGPGHYSVDLSISDELAMFSYCFIEDALRFEVITHRNEQGLASVEGILNCEHEWK